MGSFVTEIDFSMFRAEPNGFDPINSVRIEKMRWGVKNCCECRK